MMMKGLFLQVARAEDRTVNRIMIWQDHTCIIQKSMQRQPSILQERDRKFILQETNKGWMMKKTLLDHRCQANSRQVTNTVVGARMKPCGEGENNLRRRICIFIAPHPGSEPQSTSDGNNGLPALCHILKWRFSNRVRFLPFFNDCCHVLQEVMLHSQPKNGLYALWSATNRWYVVKCVSQKRNRSNNNKIWYNILVSFIFKFSWGLF